MSKIIITHSPTQMYFFPPEISSPQENQLKTFSLGGESGIFFEEVNIQSTVKCALQI